MPTAKPELTAFRMRPCAREKEGGGVGERRRVVEGVGAEGAHPDGRARLARANNFGPDRVSTLTRIQRGGGVQLNVACARRAEVAAAAAAFSALAEAGQVGKGGRGDACAHPAASACGEGGSYACRPRGAFRPARTRGKPGGCSAGEGAAAAAVSWLRAPAAWLARSRCAAAGARPVLRPPSIAHADSGALLCSLVVEASWRARRK